MQQFREPPQVKEFDTVTHLRKVAIELITPIVKKIEGHVAVVLEEGERFRQDNARLKNVADFQEQLRQQMQTHASSIQAIQEELSKLVPENAIQRDTDDSLRANDERIRASSEMEVTSLRIELNKKSTRIEQLNTEKQELRGSVTAIKHALREEILAVHNSFREVAQQTQMKTNEFSSKSEQLERRLQETEELLEIEKTKSIQSSQRLQLYTREREEINQKMNHLYQHIFGHVSTDEFDKYKKYQNLEIKSAIQRMQQIVDSALTPEVRRFLPTVIEGVEQLRKVQKLEAQQLRLEQTLQEKHATSLESMIEIEKKLVEKMETAQTNNLSDHLVITERLKMESQQLLTQINSKIDRIEKEQILEKVDGVRQSMEKKIEVQHTTLTAKMDSVVQDKKSEIFDAVRNLIPQEEVQFFNMMKSFLPKIEEIKNNVEARCAAIELIATNLQETLERFSNRITKVKTDLDMRHDMLITDIKYLQRNRQENNIRLEKVGLSLSVHAEMLTLLNTYVVHVEACKRKSKVNAQVFVSLLDGMIYELKPISDEDTIHYRKKPISRYDLMRASLTCFLSHVDSVFSEEFLAWKINKPSNLFRNNIIEQLEHQKLKQQLGSNANKPQVSISPLQVHPGQHEDPSIMTINTDRESGIAVIPPSFSRTTDGLKKMVTSTNKPKKERYENDMNTTTARIRSRNRGLSQL